MKPKYEITRTKNGYVIELCHATHGYKDENKFVAKTINEVAVIIKRLLKEEDSKA